ncbi:hypothetical protein ACFL59_07925 [Planctomycetota bacterium]
MIDSPEFGKSSVSPTVLEVRVSDKQEGVIPVGKKVHDKLFEGYPPFNFNVNFSCHGPDAISRESEYADPSSPWFNVFFGYYQVDVPIGADGDKDKWDRPFGFAGEGGKVEFEDILRIGKADWGYFSNWMYGVPEEDIDKVINNPDFKPPTCTVTDKRVEINGKEYVECVVDGIKVPSAYVSGRDGKHLKKNDKLLSPAWQAIFGKQGAGVTQDPKVAEGYKESFCPTEMKMKFYMRVDKRWDDDFQSYVYSTSIYGGGINKTWAGDSESRKEYNEAFLDAQMTSLKDVMPKGTGTP